MSKEPKKSTGVVETAEGKPFTGAVVPIVPAATVPEPSPQEKLAKLIAEMAEASRVGDVSKILAAAEGLKSWKLVWLREEAKAQQAEAEALAGARKELADKIFGVVEGLGLDDEIRGLKATGFVYRPRQVDPKDPSVTILARGFLEVPALRPVAVSSGSGSKRGKTSDEYGLTLDAIAMKYGSPEQLATLADSTVSNSSKWATKTIIKKAALASGALKPIK